MMPQFGSRLFVAVARFVLVVVAVVATDASANDGRRQVPSGPTVPLWSNVTGLAQCTPANTLGSEGTSPVAARCMWLRYLTGTWYLCKPAPCGGSSNLQYLRVDVASPPAVSGVWNRAASQNWLAVAEAFWDVEVDEGATISLRHQDTGPGDNTGALCALVMLAPVDCATARSLPPTSTYQPMVTPTATVSPRSTKTAKGMSQTTTHSRSATGVRSASRSVTATASRGMVPPRTTTPTMHRLRTSTATVSATASVVLAPLSAQALRTSAGTAPVTTVADAVNPAVGGRHEIAEAVSATSFGGAVATATVAPAVSSRALRTASVLGATRTCRTAALFSASADGGVSLPPPSLPDLVPLAVVPVATPALLRAAASTALLVALVVAAHGAMLNWASSAAIAGTAEGFADRSARVQHTTGIAAPLFVALFCPGVAGAASLGLFHSDGGQVVSAVLLVAAFAPPVAVTYFAARSSHLTDNVRMAATSKGPTDTATATATASAAIVTSKTHAAVFEPTDAASATSRRAALATMGVVDGARDPASALHRAYYGCDVLAACGLAVLAGVLPTTRAGCMAVAWLVCLATLGVLVYHAHVKPLRSAIETAFAVAASALQFAVAGLQCAGVTLGSDRLLDVSEDVSGFVVLALCGVFIVQPLVLAGHAVLQWRRRRDHARHDAASTVPPTAAPLPQAQQPLLTPPSPQQQQQQQQQRLRASPPSSTTVLPQAQPASNPLNR